MTSTIKFHGAVHQNLYLVEGGREVHAVITVDAEGDLAATANTPPPEAAEVIILDCSGSMGSPPEKIVKAKQAAGVAIDGLRDGVLFALVAGSLGPGCSGRRNPRWSLPTRRPAAKPRRCCAGSAPTVAPPSGRGCGWLVSCSISIQG